ncbi:MAG TPA: type II toxin-antitoxin system prevent-host-death family antitoxin [Caulobacteraceae bacterium]
MAENAVQDVTGSVEVGGHDALWQIGPSLDNSHLDGYLVQMATYSVAEAKNHLPRLLNEALAGEEVTITRRGKAIARLVAEQPPIETEDRPESPHDVEWLRRHAVKPLDPTFDSVALLRAMRDDYRY